MRKAEHPQKLYVYNDWPNKRSYAKIFILRVGEG